MAAKQAMRGNSFDPDVLTQYLKRIEMLAEDIAAEKARAANEVKAIKGEQREVFGEAKDAGLPVKPLKALVKQRMLDRKAAALREKLDMDQRSDLEQMMDALGEYANSPLGQAALEHVR